MSTYYLTLAQFNLIKNRVPFANPICYKDDGITCVKVKLNDDIFYCVAKKLGWI